MKKLTTAFVVIGSLFIIGVKGQTYEDAFQHKASILIDQTADRYNPPDIRIGDPEKYFWPKAIARFNKYGLHDSIANSYVALFRNNAPFHFTLIGMARIMSLYSEAPAMKKHELQYLQQVFNRKDSFNPWSGEGTENHVSMSRTSGYLFAQHALLQPDVFTTASQRLMQMAEWIEYTVKRNYAVGTGEWNSSTYGAYNIIGWLNLYDFASDEKVRLIAKAALDYYATELALHYSYGAIGGSEMRGGKSSLHTATSYLAWLWYGDENDAYANEGMLKGNQYIQCVHAATSKYRPPAVSVNLARKRNTTPKTYFTSQPAYLLDQPSYIKQTFYIDQDFTLGSAVLPYGGYTGSTAQIITWKMVVRPAEGNLPVEISGNGMSYDQYPTVGRDPHTQIVQHKNTLLQMTCVPVEVDRQFESVKKIVEQWQVRWQSDFDKRFPDDAFKKKNIVTFRQNMTKNNQSFLVFPFDVEIDSSSNVAWVDAGNAFLAIRSLKLTLPEKVLQDGRCFLIDNAPLGELCGFVIETVSKTNYTTLNQFKAYARKAILKVDAQKVMYKTSSDDQVDACYVSKGTFTEAISDWGYGKEKPQVLISSPPLQQPVWPSGKGWGKIPSWSVNSKPVVTEKNWPVWNGPDLSLANSVLELKEGKRIYRVDFRSTYPTFFDKIE